ncbi:hypothetical protein KIPB_008690 [Kipferlia bialata]|uniref:Uncharacterized protein n=1 Tax=Kipferlia bialata TaxID=797122 RepID=A0A9K3GKX7_9EUKA|nr:hypothetical protein KIPB_008690 [Kipferlia bialata]|eukprot:g8690.t1
MVRPGRDISAPYSVEYRDWRGKPYRTMVYPDLLVAYQPNADTTSDPECPEPTEYPAAQWATLHMLLCASTMALTVHTGVDALDARLEHIHNTLNGVCGNDPSPVGRDEQGRAVLCPELVEQARPVIERALDAPNGSPYKLTPVLSRDVSVLLSAIFSMCKGKEFCLWRGNSTGEHTPDGSAVHKLFLVRKCKIHDMTIRGKLFKYHRLPPESAAPQQVLDLFKGLESSAQSKDPWVQYVSAMISWGCTSCWGVASVRTTKFSHVSVECNGSLRYRVNKREYVGNDRAWPLQLQNFNVLRVEVLTFLCEATLEGHGECLTDGLTWNRTKTNAKYWDKWTCRKANICPQNTITSSLLGIGDWHLNATQAWLSRHGVKTKAEHQKTTFLTLLWAALGGTTLYATSEEKAILQSWSAYPPTVGSSRLDLDGGRCTAYMGALTVINEAAGKVKFGSRLPLGPWSISQGSGKCMLLVLPGSTRPEAFGAPPAKRVMHKMPERGTQF